MSNPAAPPACGGGEAVQLALDIAADDTNRQRKLLLLQQEGLALRIAPDQSLETSLSIARCVSLSEEELYFLQEAAALREPLNPRNEAAAVASLLPLLQQLPEPQRGAELEALSQHLERYGAALRRLQGEGESGAAQPAALRDLPVESWAASRGIDTSACAPAEFGGGLRGLAARRALAPGDVMLSVPAGELVHEGTARESELGAVLSGMPGLDGESLLLVWTMVDAEDAESPRAPFWQSLPRRIVTGASLPPAARRALEGSPLAQEADLLAGHLGEQYERIVPLLDALTSAYPDYIAPAAVSRERYMWAAQLWYAYAIQVEFPGKDGGVRPCLVPYVCLLNHTHWPHCVHYSRLEGDPGAAGGARLRCTALRGAAPGDQVYLGYGALPNARLLLFYGFALPGNPHDTLPIDLEGAAEADDDPAVSALRASLADAWGLPHEHALRGTGPLPAPLLAHLCLLSASSVDELRGMQKQGLRPGALHKLEAPPCVRRCALESLASLLRALGEQLPRARSRAPSSAAAHTGSDSAAARSATASADGGGGAAAAGEGSGQGAEEDAALLRACRVYVAGLAGIVAHNLRLAEQALRQLPPEQ